MRRNSCVAVVLALALTASAFAAGSSAIAQQPPAQAALEITVELTPPTVTLGQHTQLVISVQHSSDLQVDARPPQRGEAIDLIAEGDPLTTVSDGGLALTTIVFTLAAFDLGTQPIGEIVVGWLRSNGETGSQTVTPPAIEVATTRAADDVVLRPLKTQLAIEGGPADWVRPATLVAVLVAAVTAVTLLGRWLWRQRGRHEREAPLIPDTAAEQLARQRLDIVATVGPRSPTAPDYQTYYGELATVVRGYLTQRFGFNASALTTLELEDRMTAEGVGRWQARLVSGLLDRCDAAVFAHKYPDPTSADHDLTVAFEIIELSRPPTQTRAEIDEDQPVPA